MNIFDFLQMNYSGNEKSLEQLRTRWIKLLRNWLDISYKFLNSTIVLYMKKYSVANVLLCLDLDLRRLAKTYYI